MIFRLLLVLCVFQTTATLSQKNDLLAISAGLEFNHFAEATPWYFAADFHLRKNRSMLTIGYSVPLYFSEFMDNDEITPISMKVPSLNLSYTYKFIMPGNERFSVGATIAYRLGHWRWREGSYTQDYGAGTFLDTSIIQVTHVTTREKRESDFHQFQFGVLGEFPVGKLRFIASIGVGIVYQASYHFDEETTYYNDGSTTKQPYYHQVTPFRYLTPSWTAKIGMMLPLSIFRW